MPSLPPHVPSSLPRSSAGSSPSRGVSKITMLSKRKFSACSYSSDIEDSLLHRFRKNQALSETEEAGRLKFGDWLSMNRSWST
ncbi:unnamed protein product [Eruca vesicaria subsp. sativa]|uniref:Uncharacterized protein n=1 Tax=Eruca vesicaria subsp. sativa TaxID=29727 RepID=A0ABC8J3P7_ERUVS|nr:unnamed protein product [Eruca vesicaria subsp. sativa]